MQKHHLHVFVDARFMVHVFLHHLKICYIWSCLYLLPKLFPINFGAFSSLVMFFLKWVNSSMPRDWYQVLVHCGHMSGLAKPCVAPDSLPMDCCRTGPYGQSLTQADSLKYILC